MRYLHQTCHRLLVVSNRTLALTRGRQLNAPPGGSLLALDCPSRVRDRQAGPQKRTQRYRGPGAVVVVSYMSPIVKDSS
jgi:hypothetical protein